jgi:hypothetical protein
MRKRKSETARKAKTKTRTRGTKKALAATEILQKCFTGSVKWNTIQKDEPGIFGEKRRKRTKNEKNCADERAEPGEKDVPDLFSKDDVSGKDRGSGNEAAADVERGSAHGERTIEGVKLCNDRIITER